MQEKGGWSNEKQGDLMKLHVIRLQANQECLITHIQNSIDPSFKLSKI